MKTRLSLLAGAVRSCFIPHKISSTNPLPHPARSVTTATRYSSIILSCNTTHLPLVIFFTETLEHLSDPTKALNEIKRVLKVNGKAVITVPSNLFIWKFRKYLTTTHPHNEPFHHNFSKSELRNLLNNFRILEIHRIVFGLTLLAIVEKNG